MKEIYISEIGDREVVQDFFMVKSAAIRIGSNRKEYFDIMLGDKTGEISGKKWDVAGESEELSQSEFVPRDFELSIGKDIKPYKIETEEGASISVYGVIDRVDVMEKNGETYVRIIDYKTGKKEFKLSDILFGLNMQMLIYMEALCQGTGKYKGTKI